MLQGITIVNLTLSERVSNMIIERAIADIVSRVNY